MSPIKIVSRPPLSPPAVEKPPAVEVETRGYNDILASNDDLLPNLT